jgi:hypothetical protein
MYSREFELQTRRYANGYDPEVQYSEDRNLSEGWDMVVGDRKLVAIHTCEFGFAEEVVGLMVFDEGTEITPLGPGALATMPVFSYEVGVGESLRPYVQVHVGTDTREALSKFFAACMAHIDM